MVWPWKLSGMGSGYWYEISDSYLDQNNDFKAARQPDGYQRTRSFINPTNRKLFVEADYVYANHL